MTTPRISVLIPAWNAENTITAAVWSVLNQSFSDFELLIYIDGATDKTVDMVAPLEDPRIRLMVEGQNRGIVHSRNTLLKAATAPYIAWLDADDIMLPGRLADQYEFLKANPGVDILGGWAELRNSDLKKVSTGPDSDYLETSLLFRNPFLQSSIMARNFFVQDGLLYDAAFEYTEDYDLYLRCLAAGKHFGMLPRFVVSYRMPGESEWNAKREQYRLDEKLEALLLRTHPSLEAEAAPVVLDFLRNNRRPDAGEFRILRRFLVNLKRRLRREKKYTAGVAAAMLFQRFRLIRLRFGLWRALLRLAGTKPAIVRLMLKNRTRRE